jgi:hypothetical protein
MSINRDDFDKMFDPEMVHEFRSQFNQLQLDRQKEIYENNPEEKWMIDFASALSTEGVVFYRTEEQEELFFVQLITELKDKKAVEPIYIGEIEEYMSIGVPAEAVAAAIRAGLLSSVFKFWRKVGEEDA